MSTKAAKEMRGIAKFYDSYAKGFPGGSLGRLSNRAEADKYHDLAAKAQTWPEEASDG